MRIHWQISENIDGPESDGFRFRSGKFVTAALSIAFALLIGTLAGSGAHGQVNVVTRHNDIARTGQNLKETILTPATVSGGTFGKLFSQTVSSDPYAQPLYVSNVTIPGKGVHNVVYVATMSDQVYAFDADSNGGADATPLWQVSLYRNTTYNVLYGVIGTPVIDLSTNTMYLVSSEDLSTSTSTLLYRMHALDITTGAEKFGAPIQIEGSVAGTGVGSTNGVLAFDPVYQLQRSGLLLLNGVVYVAFSSNNDNGAWHGWIFSYSAATLQQLNVFCTTPNGMGGGIWMGASGLAAEVYNTAKPYGRMFVATGNGSFTASPPYNSSMGFSMSLLDLDLTGGKMTVEDTFTPSDWLTLNAQDGDFGSGGPVLLPKQNLASGRTLNPLIHAGKSGELYILDRDNNTDGSNNAATEYTPAGLGGFNANGDQVVQELQTPESGKQNWGSGVWGTEAYWNNSIYFGGTNPSQNTSIAAYSFVNGVMSTTAASHTATQFSYPGSTPSISANGNTAGIMWVLTHGTAAIGPATLQAYDATNLANLLYSSNTNPARDSLGQDERWSSPVIANGKVYVNNKGALTVYGLPAPTAAAPAINPPGASFAGSLSVTITDTTPGAQIFYTTDGSTPTVASIPYTGAITVSANETISALASATGYLQSATTAASFNATSTTANPVFSLPGGTYYGTSQTLTITDSTVGAVVYYTVDGTTPTTASPIYKRPIPIPVQETIQAFAVAPGLLASSTVSASYDIDPAYVINFTQGFANAQGPMSFNGSTTLDDFRLQLTNGGYNQAGSAFFATPVNVQSFSTNFTFQISNPVGDGMTFTIQGNKPTALGANASNLGFGGIPNSIGIKFDIYNGAGQGNDSTGLYLDGVSPTLPSIDLTNTGIDLHSGDYMNVQITYDGTILNMTIQDAITLATWSHAFTVNIPFYVGGPTAYVGFTGGTGGATTASQKLTSWTYLPGPPPIPNYPAGFDPAGLTLNGSAALVGTGLQLTGAVASEAGSAFYTAPVDISSFTTNFDFQITKAVADGMTFTIQGNGPFALGANARDLGFGGITYSVGIKFDIYNNAGEGNDSTGVYIDGVTPTVPSINLASSGVTLGSGDIIAAKVSYDGTTLTWTLTDLTLPSHPSVTNSMQINIPAVIGGTNVGWIGFTGSTGGVGAVQTVLNWTFTNP